MTLRTPEEIALAEIDAALTRIETAALAALNDGDVGAFVMIAGWASTAHQKMVDAESAFASAIRSAVDAETVRATAAENERCAGVAEKATYRVQQTSLGDYVDYPIFRREQIAVYIRVKEPTR